MSCSCPFTGSATCHCAGCHETFTAVTAFDLHQRLNEQGNVCLSPAYARRRSGAPVFTVIRLASDSRPVWGQATENTFRRGVQEKSPGLTAFAGAPGKGAA